MAASTTSSTVVHAPRSRVMAVIADFGSYPLWASSVRSAEVIARDEAGQASQVRFGLDAGVVKDSYILRYRWDGDAGVRWQLSEPGSVITVLTGGYELTDIGAATTVTYSLTVELRIPLPGILRRRAEKAIIDSALRGLAERAEGAPGGPGEGGRT